MYMPYISFFWPTISTSSIHPAIQTLGISELFYFSTLSAHFFPLEQLSRNQRFSASFHQALETLVHTLMPHITQKYKDNLDAASNANHSLAVFIKVCD